MGSRLVNLIKKTARKTLVNRPLDNSRRSFLLAASSSACLFGFARQVEASQTIPADKIQHIQDKEYVFEPTIWSDISEDGTINININRAEMGQHIGTALARIMADEMDANWDDVVITHVDTDPKWGQMVTGGSWSVNLAWDNFRQAGAAMRQTLLENGARLLNTTPNQCQVISGKVNAGGKSISFGEIVKRARPTKEFSQSQLDTLPLKKSTERSLIGKPVESLDIAPKTNGTAIYGIDVKLKNMVYARPKLPPTRYGSKIISIHDEKAREVPGYLRYVILNDPSETVPGWVVVIAKTYPAAIRATDLLDVKWEAGEAAQNSEKDLIEYGRKQIDTEEGGARVVNDPDVKKTFAKAHRILKRTYTCASVSHYQLEPVNALARYHDGLWEIHCGNQWQSLTLPLLAKALNVPPSKVVMRSYLLGGGFGRRLNGDYAVPAALTSQVLGGQAVKLILTRSDDMAFDSIRSPSIQTIRAAIDDDHHIIAWEHHISAGWPTRVMAPQALAKGDDGKAYDPFAVATADHWYDVGPMLVRGLDNDLISETIRPGWLRSVSAGWTPWAYESFIDEVAHDYKKDPFEFRLELLTAKGRNEGHAPESTGGAKRLAHVLKRLAEKSQYHRTKLPKDTAIGIACTNGQERNMPTWTAGAVQVHVDRATGLVTCQKIWLVLDAGIIVDPNGACAQTEGGALWGLSMALFEENKIENGQIADTNLDSYTPLRISDTPEIDIEFIDNNERPAGLGEPGVTTIAPAIGNAIYKAVGVRLYHLPIKPADVLDKLSQIS